MHPESTSSRINLVSLKGWRSLIEDRIDVRKLPVCLTWTHSVIDTESPAFGPVRQGERQGLANRAAERGARSVHCRGGVSHESNSERNGAAPPWVEIHDLASIACKAKHYAIELEAAVNAFRETLRQPWTRRAIWMLTITQPVLSYRRCRRAQFLCVIGNGRSENALTMTLPSPN